MALLLFTCMMSKEDKRGLLLTIRDIPEAERAMLSTTRNRSLLMS